MIECKVNINSEKSNTIDFKGNKEDLFVEFASMTQSLITGLLIDQLGFNGQTVHVALDTILINALEEARKGDKK